MAAPPAPYPVPLSSYAFDLRYLVLESAIVLCICYAMSGTYIRYAATGDGYSQKTRPLPGMSGTHTADAARCPFEYGGNKLQCEVRTLLLRSLCCRLWMQSCRLWAQYYAIYGSSAAIRGGNHAIYGGNAPSFHYDDSSAVYGGENGTTSAAPFAVAVLLFMEPIPPLMSVVRPFMAAAL
eukprot:2290757-Rhodomonas_salina.1